MPEIKEHSIKEFRLRAKLPQYFRYGALVLLSVAILAVIVGFYRERTKTPFKLKSEHTQLSTDVVAEVNNYERLESDGELSKYYVKADYAKTFSDNHQELENVYIRTYDKVGVEAETMTAQRVLYVPEPEKNFTAYMSGDVHIDTRDALKIKTNNIVYTKRTETAEADEAVEFERDNVRGKSFGATVNMLEKRLDLPKDVEIETFESPELLKSNIRYAKVNAASAVFDQSANKIQLETNVVIDIKSKAKGSGNAQTTDIKCDHATLYFVRDPGQAGASGAELKKFELVDNVHIVSAEPGAPGTTIDAGYGLYDKDADRYELKTAVHIVTNPNDKPTDIRAGQGTYEQSALRLALSGDTEITQGTDLVKGSTVNADLFPDKKLKYVVVRGNGLVRQSGTARTTTINAPEINASWGDSRLLQTANTAGESNVVLDPNGDAAYSLVTLAAPRAIHVVFKGEGLIDQMRTEGRTTIQLDSVNRGSDSANKRVTADVVNTFFYANGKDIKRAEAVGNAELFIEPLKASKENYRTTIDAPRFDCDFFAAGNNARSCIGGKKTKTVRVPTVPDEKHGTQTLLADQLKAGFAEQAKDIDRLDCTGSVKFTELDRNAIAQEMAFTQSDGYLRLKGGEPTTWDSKARARAKEIDWDTRNNKSYLRGGVSTTYYSRKQMNDALPFGTSDKPVFITAETAEIDHTAQTAIYAGNARGWQENNYVRGSRLLIDQAAGTFFAEGNVQSAMYNARIPQKSKDSAVPVFAAAGSLAYDRQQRVLKYKTGVDIRQGTDRLTAASADVYLDESNEVTKTIAENNVVVTQPLRRATGDWVQYTAGDEVAVLRGSPATISDSENGTSQAGQLTFNMRSNQVSSDSKTVKNPGGRSRSVYKIKPNQ